MTIEASQQRVVKRKARCLAKGKLGRSVASGDKKEKRTQHKRDRDDTERQGTDRQEKHKAE